MSRRDEYCLRARDVNIRVVDVAVLSGGTGSSSSHSSSSSSYGGGGGGSYYQFGTGRIAPRSERPGPNEFAMLCGWCRQNLIIPRGNTKDTMSVCPNCCGSYASRFGRPE
jgi:hypothetical protein